MESIRKLLLQMDKGADSPGLRSKIAQEYLKLGLISQAREFVKTIPGAASKVDSIFKADRPDQRFRPHYPGLNDLKKRVSVNRINSQWVIASAASSSYFLQLLNCIGSIYKNCLENIWKIVIYDLGLTQEQQEYINCLYAVKLKKVPKLCNHMHAWWTWKIWILKDCAENETAGPFLYCDAGIQIQNDLTSIFEIMHRKGYVLFHAGGHLNRDWTTEYVYQKLGINMAEDSSPQLVSGIQGYLSRGIIKAKAIDAAYQMIADENLLRPRADCPDNRHEQSLLSLILAKNDIHLLDFGPYVAWMDADESTKNNASFWLCRHTNIGGHYPNLIKKTNQTANKNEFGDMQKARSLMSSKGIHPIVEAESLLRRLADADEHSEEAVCLLKQEIIEHAFHKDLCFQSLFDLLVRLFCPSVIVETGTFMGWSTEFMALNYPFIDIHSTESNSRFAKLARSRLKKYKNVSIYQESSEKFLKEFLFERSSAGPCIFFLDAHWEEYWPLPDEISLIGKSEKRAIIIVDDFKIPGKPDFGHDEYGAGKRCEIDSLLPHLNPKISYHAFLPSYSHTLEAKAAEHLRGRLILFQNCDEVFRLFQKDPWVMARFEDASSLLSVPVPLSNPAAVSEQSPSKIVALIPVKNEAARIEFCLRAISKFSDAVCVFDDASEDGTVEIIEALAAECRVERIIRNRSWNYNETKYRQTLLNAGREIGGTHFIVLDADEAFTSNFMHGDHLRKFIYSLQSGDSIQMVWIQLWRSTKNFRHDGSVWTDNYKKFIFADDGKCNYREQLFHLPRIPSGLQGKSYLINGYRYGVMHFQFVNWRNLLIKQAWYRCLERITNPVKPVEAINRLYAPSKDENGLRLKAAPQEWFSRYDFFNEQDFEIPDRWRENQVLAWFEKYGREFFAELDIWDVDFGAKVNNARPLISKEKLFSNPDIIDYGIFSGTSIWYGQMQHREKSQDLVEINEKYAAQPSMEKYLVSAIVSAYNSERFIRGCLMDLENQTIADQMEIIVVNSGSQQNEEVVVKEFQQKYENIKYLKTERRESVYASWNRGIRAAAGKYITNANTDDRHAPYAFERMAGILDRNDDIALVYANLWITETENETFEKFTPVGKFTWMDFDPQTLIEGCYVGPQPMWRKSLHQKYGYFEENYESAGDWEFWLRISKTEKFLHLKEVLGLYLKSPTSIEHRDPGLVVKEAERVQQQYK